MRVLLVDDHEMFTEALACRLSGVAELWVIGRCTVDGLHKPEIGRLHPDVITIEVESFDTGASELLGRLRTAWPPARIVVLTASHDPRQVLDAARAGADAWVPKESSADQLLATMQAVRRGHACYPAEHLGAVLQGLREDIRRLKDDKGPLDALSDRELVVLRSLVEGKRSKQTAKELDMSTNTVRTHTNNIFAKLHVHTRLEAVSAAREAGMRPASGRDKRIGDS